MNHEPEKQDFHHNLIRKVDSKDLPEQISFRLKNEIDALKFEKLKKENQNRTGNNGNQKTSEFILNLAWQRFQELQNLDKEITKASK